jgi:hypothetical protein
MNLWGDSGAVTLLDSRLSRHFRGLDSHSLRGPLNDFGRPLLSAACHSVTSDADLPSFPSQSSSRHTGSCEDVRLVTEYLIGYS